MSVTLESPGDMVEDAEDFNEGPPKKYKRYNEDDLQFAMKEVNAGNMSINKAAQKYNIPSKTIAWRIKNPKIQKQDDHRGALKVLNCTEETKITNWLIESAKLGNPKTIDDLKEIAVKVRSLRPENDGPSFKNQTPSTHWIIDFLQRNKNVTFRKAEALSRSAANVNESKIRRFFTNFYTFLEEHDYLDVLERPDAFYNVDESGFQLNASIDRVLAEKGSKNVYKVQGSKPKEMITATFGFGADGSMLPTQIIYKSSFSKSFEAAVEIGKTGADFLLSSTPSGWQTKDSFNGYIQYIVEYLEAKHVAKPFFITYDNHASHLNYDLFTWCYERNVHIVTFPPNTTHILQMCDVGIFSAAKNGWKKEVEKFKKTHNVEMNEISFIGVLKNMIDKVITKEKIVNGFRATGIMPFNVNNIDMSKCIGNDYPSENIEEVPVANYEKSASFMETESIYDEQLVIEKLPLNYLNEEHAVDEYDDNYGEEYSTSVNQNDCLPPYLTDVYEYHQTSDNNNEDVQIGPGMSNDVNGLTKEERRTKIKSILANMKQEAATLKHLMIAEKSEDIDIVNLQCMEQQLGAYHKKYSKSIQPASSNASVNQPIDDILKLPEKYKRKTNRVYREKNYGIMTHSSVINTHKEAAEKLKEADDVKEQKRTERQLKKDLQLNILKIKKEKNEEVKQVAKKRGRPKKQ